MNAPDDDRDAERTADWPGAQNAPGADDGEATTVVPRTSQQSTPPPPTAPPPTMWPPQTGQWDPRWQTSPGPGSPPPGAWAPPVPSSPYAPGPYPPATPQPPKRRQWGLLAIGALVVVVITVAVTVFVTRGSESSTPTAARSSTSAPASSSASTPTTTAAALVQPAALKGLLASVADVTQIANNAMMTPTLTRDSPILGVHVDPFDCTGAVMTAMDSTYYLYTAFAVQLLNNGPQNIDVIQALASFPREADAKAFVDSQFRDWQSCDNTDVIVSVDGRYGGPPQRGRVSNVVSTEDINSLLISPPSGVEGRHCEHAMSVRKNVVVDARVCAPSVGSMGRDLARALGERITGQR